ncbi:chemotaxis protein [Anaerocolumna sp. AGMB13025]|uniref:chemotaxis protein n=1 Tax=Anaerocolumna sp. AGMB13025 TaxID=3039116 RepID=UPI00241F6364|nr:chemotaxis protein [Anaerocolumna sp. AGMB13025]WFR59830.1 chemotaxis protein [Anaerocolumna sp. AGMB13025]
MNTGVLLESGTNELEILEFRVGNNFYGINVAKIREILPYQAPTPVPNAHPCIEGIFMPRDTIITVINLAKCLNIPDLKDQTTDMNVITNFNKLNVAFHVHGVVGIHRISWEDINKPDETINSIATGIIKFEEKLIIVLDFEKIISDISPETGLKVSDINHLGVRNRNEAPILIAEDSPLLSKLIEECLSKAGYTNVILTGNGLEAWNKLQEFKNNNRIETSVKCIITDIEMPQMDGHHFTKLVKTDQDMKYIPIIIFSSLINDEMKRKGDSVGADAQITKPEIGSLVEILDKFILQ